MKPTRWRLRPKKRARRRRKWTHPPRRVRFDVLTLFPELFTSYVGQSLLKLAIQERLVEVHCWDMRDWSTDKHHKVDDRPFGGGGWHGHQA